MVNRNWFDAYGWNWGQETVNNAQQLPTRTAPDQFAPTRVSPTRNFVQRNVMNTYVPHVHPSHLTNVNQHNIHNHHHFPHTESVVNECFETHTMCGTPFNPHRWGCGHRHRKGW